MADEDSFNLILYSKESDELICNERAPLRRQDSWTTIFRTQTRSCLVALTCIVLLALLAALFFTSPGHPSLRSLQSNNARYGFQADGPSFQQHFTEKDGATTTFPMTAEDDILPKLDRCYLCNCSASIPYYSPPANATVAFQRMQVGDIWRRDGVNANEFIRKTIFDMYCAKAYLTSDQARNLLHGAMKNPKDAMAWSLNGLTTKKPTIYLHTATSPHSKSNPFRSQYIQRHGRAIRRWLALQELAGKSEAWQVVWILTEDDIVIDPLIARTLLVSRVPFVYFAYGMTNSWGNAQKNAGMQMAYALSRPMPRGLFGHGPVYGMDDDNQVMPEFYDHAVTISRFGIIPVAAFLDAGHATLDEELIVNDKGVVTGIRAGWTGAGGGKYPVDYAGIVYNSSMLGSVLKGPDFWGWDGFGGESNFVSLCVGNFAGIEILCKKGQGILDNGCDVLVTHNKELSAADKIIEDPFVASMQLALGIS